MLSLSEIAARLHLSDTTVKSRVARIPARLDLRDRTQAVVAAYEIGLVRPGDDTTQARTVGAGSHPFRVAAVQPFAYSSAVRESNSNPMTASSPTTHAS